MSVTLSELAEIPTPLLPESTTPLPARLVNLRDSITAGCTELELVADTEVAISALGIVMTALQDSG